MEFSKLLSNYHTVSYLAVIKRGGSTLKNTLRVVHFIMVISNGLGAMDGSCSPGRAAREGQSFFRATFNIFTSALIY